MFTIMIADQEGFPCARSSPQYKYTIGVGIEVEPVKNIQSSFLVAGKCDLLLLKEALHDISESQGHGFES